MKKHVINCETGEESIVDLTPEEVAEVNADDAGIEARTARQQAINNLKASAKAKLVAGEALTQEEADTIVV